MVYCLQSALKSGGFSGFKIAEQLRLVGGRALARSARWLGRPAVGSACVRRSGIKQGSVSLKNSPGAACRARALQGDRQVFWCQVEDKEWAGDMGKEAHGRMIFRESAPGK